MVYRVLLDFFAAVILLTRIPVPWSKLSDAPPNLSLSQWAFPVVGIFLGIIVSLIIVFFTYIGLSSISAACIGLASIALITGVLHEDGLADFADGFGGGKTVENKIKIMKDSTVGAYGASALILSYFLRISLLASFTSSFAVIITCIFVFSSGRTSMILARKLASPISESNSASLLRPASTPIIILSIAICSVFFLYYGIVFFLLGISLIYLVPKLITKLAQQKIGGINGDVLGTCCQTTETSLLILAVIWFQNA